jgi:Flp pilus assembly protein TadG
MSGLAVFARFRDKGRDERGVVLVLAAIMMVVFLGMAALAIDVGYFDQQQRQAQSAADAAALAGAQELPGSAANATSQAKSFVISNMPAVPHTYPGTCATPPAPGVCITTPYNGNSKQIQVTVTESANSLFGHIFGINSTKVSATAVAGNTVSTLCASPGNTCYAIFAKDSDCTAGHNSISFSGGGNIITGGILANGNVSAGGGGSTFGPSTFGPSASGCTWPAGSDSHTSGPTSESTVLTTYPIDYTTDFPPCSGAACTGPCDTGTTCTSAHHTPSFCTDANTVTPLSLSPLSGHIYCAIGTGLPNTPSSWNGAISIGAGSVVAEATYVGGSVAVGGGGDNLTACGYASTGYTASGCAGGVPTPPTGNYPLIYATGTSSSAINGGGGGSSFHGDLFAPLGGISFGGGGDTTSFLEALDVNYTGGGLTGDGPSTSGTGSSTSGLASLVQ